MTDKTALFRKASFGLCGVLAGVILVLFSVSAAQAQAVPPAANAQNAKGSMDSPISITLTGSDENGDTLTYEIIQSPTHGTLSGTPPNVTYTATGDGVADSFTFRVSDGTYVSAPATVKIDRFIEPDKSNVPPAGHNQVINASVGGDIPITLTGTDADGDPIIFKTVDSPNCGALSGTAPNLTYNPAGCSGPLTDGFSFQAQCSGGRSSGDLTRVDIYLTGNAPGPVTNAGGDITVNPNDPVTLNGTSHDPTGAAISYQNWSCSDPSGGEGSTCCESGTSGYSCSSDCTLDNPGQPDPTLEVSGTGTFKCDYYVSTASGSSFDKVEVDSEAVAPSAQTGSILLLAGFCALIGVRYVRKSVRKNV
jgi:hypothetical protein